MNFGIDEEQTMIKDAARSFFSKEWSIGKLREIEKESAGYSADLWNKMYSLGWGAMLVSEAYGGMGCEYMRLSTILEEMGRALFPSPYLVSCVMAASILEEAGNETIKSHVLSRIAGGESIVSIALGNTGGHNSQEANSLEAKKGSKDFTLTGTCLFVPYANDSNYIICHAKDKSSSSGGSLFIVDTTSKGITCTPIPTFSIDKYSKVEFDHVGVPRENLVGEAGKGADVIQKLMPRLVVSRCLEMVGGMQKVLEMTIQFTKDREQFGVPIGSFQIIQHYCANMAIDVAAAKAITYKAAWKVSEQSQCKKDVSMAKAWTGEAYKRVTALALQCHGAMGFTEEYDLQYYYKQAKSLHLMYGSGAYHRDIVAHEMGYL